MEIISNVAEELPPVLRKRSGSEERDQIAALLEDGGVHAIDGMEDEKVYNSTQQKVRDVARKLGIGVSIRHQDGLLYFQATEKRNSQTEETSTTEEDWDNETV